MKVMNSLGIDRLFSPATDYLAGEASIGRLLQGAKTPVYAKTLISRLFALCAQAQRGGGFTVVS